MKTFGLIGYPLSHSFSPNYFARKFKVEKISGAEYTVFPLKKIEDFNVFIEQNPSLTGLNVTIPYKETIIPYLNKLDSVSKKIGAVNCIKILKTNPQNNSETPFLSGYNTDVWGFEKSLLKYLKQDHKKALILGTGGSSKAVCFVLEKLNIDFFFVSRKTSSSKYNESQNFPTLKSDYIIGYDDLNENIISESALIINCTPLGMFPKVEKAPPLPYHFLSSSHLLFDLIYNPQETLFLKKGREQSATTVNGMEMLKLQADKSWEIWNSPDI